MSDWRQRSLYALARSNSDKTSVVEEIGYDGQRQRGYAAPAGSSKGRCEMQDIIIMKYMHDRKSVP